MSDQLLIGPIIRTFQSMEHVVAYMINHFCGRFRYPSWLPCFLTAPDSRQCVEQAPKMWRRGGIDIHNGLLCSRSPTSSKPGRIFTEVTEDSDDTVCVCFEILDDGLPIGVPLRQLLLIKAAPGQNDERDPR